MLFLSCIRVNPGLQDLLSHPLLIDFFCQFTPGKNALLRIKVKTLGTLSPIPCELLKKLEQNFFSG